MTDKWQPIDTAPRDGTRILAWFPPNVQALDGDMAIVQWYAGSWYSGFFVDPTMWQPLPPPPQESANDR
jgi:hypothetical protein